MSNNLTGDFDVVAQFAIPAVNRLLATMHRTERFPHSISAKVDDHKKPDVGGYLNPTLVAVMDRNGDPVTNHQRLGLPLAVVGSSSSDTAAVLTLDPIVNVGDLELEETPIVPSNLQGRVQLQVFPPTIEIPDNSGTNVTVQLEMLARYFPDPNTSPIAEFVRGDLRLTAPVTQVASQHARVVEIDIKGAGVGIDFRPTWSSRQLLAEDMMAINQVVRNALKTSFLPSSSTLPSGIAHMQFRTMRGAQQAVSILLNTSGAAGNRASATNLFLGGSDFAFGVSSDYVKRSLQPTLDKILSTPIDPISFTIDSLVHTWHITYTLTLNSAVVELENGEIVLVIEGHASTPSWTPNFDFTVRAPFTLSPSGDTANLVAGDVSLDTSSWVINRFKGAATSGVRNVRDHALSSSGALNTVRKMLSAEGNLGGFIDSLLQPPRQNNAPPLPKGFFLSYSSIEISPDGIALRGTMAVSPWPAPHVEFTQIPVNRSDRPTGGLHEIAQGPDYSALKSWIPGGVVDRYEWKPLGQTQPGFNDANRFVLLQQGPLVASAMAAAVAPVSGYRPMCVTVHGTRLSASGPVVAQPVQATVCGVNRFPFPGDFTSAESGLLSIALVQPGPGGNVEVAGHTAALGAEAGRVAPNLIVHFGDRESGKDLAVIVKALHDSRRGDASTAILAVLPGEALAQARFAEGITYSDDIDGAWSRRYGADKAKRPFTVIVTPDGKIAWKEEGRVNAEMLTDALRTTLVRSGKMRPSLNASSVRIGQIPPNFLFEYADRREITLRKMKGRHLAVVFWKTSSKESLAQIRRLEKQSSGAGENGFIVIAVNDGEPEEVVRRFAKEQNLSALVVPDVARHITLAYAVNAWPTTVWIDDLGILRSIQIGDFGGPASESPFSEAGKSPDHETAGNGRAKS